MRRLAVLIAALTVAVAATVALTRGGDEYEVSAVFDTAKGLVPGQLVKVAGARVGRVEAVRLTKDRKARITMSVRAEFGPFKDDARCQILPEGLISENYVECDPGSDGGRRLVGDLPVQRTQVPVSLQDVLDTFDLPTSERISAVITNLGIGVSGRSDDLDAVLRRANPALGQARAVLTTIARQRRALADATTQTDRVLAALAQRRRDVTRFVANAADTVDVTAGEAASLQESIRRLPPMLDAVRVGLRDLDGATTAARPLVEDLSGAAPQVAGFLEELPRFSAAGRPAVRAVASAARRTRRALPPVNRLLGDLEPLSRLARPVFAGAGTALADIRNRGGFENLLSFAYGISASTSLYDSVSHYFSLYVGVAPQCFVPDAANTVPGCNHAYTGPERGQVPINDPSVRVAQARAVARSLRAHPDRRPTDALEAAARQLFLSRRGTDADGLPQQQRIEDLLDVMLG